MSQFDNLPLPAIKDAGDFFRLVRAGETVEIPAVGDFVYAKFTDGEVKVEINGKSTFMESGDERRMGPGTVFRGVKLINETELDKSVVFVIGFGGFNRRIIQGEVTVNPGIRKGDGSFITDSRYWLNASYFINDIENVTFTYADLDETVSIADNAVTGAYFPNVNGAYIVDNNNKMKFVDLSAGTTSAAISKSLGGGDYSFTEIRGSYLPGDETKFILGGKRNSDNAPALLIVNSSFNLLGVEILPFTVDISNQNNIFSPIYIGDQLYVLAQVNGSTNVWYKKVGNDWTAISNFPSSFNYQAIHCRDGQRVVVSSRPYNVDDFQFTYVFDKDTGTELTPEAGDFNLQYGGHYIPSQRRFMALDAGQSVDLYVSETWTRTATGFVQTCATGFMFKPSEVLTEAVITGTKTDTGITLSGEVLKAVLELYSGNFIRSDYLDFIYGVEFAEESGLKPRIVSAGGDSFALAGFEDNFTVNFPQEIKIYIRNGLFEG